MSMRQQPNNTNYKKTSVLYWYLMFLTLISFSQYSIENVRVSLNLLNVHVFSIYIYSLGHVMVCLILAE